jgi:predicted dehydrogenase
MRTFRWGILGAARIARKNWKAIRHSGNGTVAAVASRDPERARQFVGECQTLEPFATPPAVFDDYAKLIAAPGVDGVYIPLPTGLRKPWVIRAAEAGKHVLCEKPCAPTAADLRDMIAACRAHDVQFMDGVMFMHNPRLKPLRAALEDEETLGQIRRINSHFTFFGAPDAFASNIRLDARLEPLGCLGDLGWYCVRFTLWAANWRMPRQVAGVTLHETNGVPTAFAGELIVGDRLSANFYCSFLEQHQQWVSVSGQRAFLRVPDFVLPLQGNATAFEIHQIASRTVGCDYINESAVTSIANAAPIDNPATAQEANMFHDFVTQVRSGRVNDAWPDAALKTQIVVDACMASARNAGRWTAVEPV